MKSLLTTLFAGICLLSFGQRENQIQVRAGFGWGVFLTESEWSYTINGLTFTENDTDGSATVHVPVELRYEFNPRFNAGIDMKFGSYLYDPNDPSTADNSNAFTT
ncbi:MAG: hypothetical protein JNM00_10830, partial [Flavobacteriales bacterium]|nr:hypothetical protein [Flavobacteriales bacterium]